jgi:tetratricopeptide (TPR) repeat protein
MAGENRSQQTRLSAIEEGVMATRVNVKFLVILSAALALVFAAVAGGFLWILLTRADRFHRAGDEALAQGDLETAQQKYWAAFHSDRSNLDPLRDYIGVLDQWVPETQPEYVEAYRKRVGSLDHIAVKLRTDIEAHRTLLEEFYRPALVNGSRAEFDNLITQATKSLAYFPNAPDEEIGVLRRYRGLGIVGLADIGNELTRDQAGRDGEPGLAEQDLKAALLADRDDSESAVALSRLYRHLADRLSDNRRERERKNELYQLSRRTIEEFLASHPADPIASLWEVRLSMNEMRSEMDSETPVGERLTGLREVGQAQEPKLRRIADEIIERELYTYPIVAQLYQIEASALQRVDLAVEVLDHAIRADPSAADMRFIRARAAAAHNAHEEAIELFTEVIESPLPPVSLKGMILISLRDSARVGRIDSALALWDLARPEEKEAALARAETFREEMGDAVRQEDPRVMLIDGKLAFARERWLEAQDRLSRYNEVTRNADAKALSLLAQIHMQKSPPEIGQARDLLSAAVQAGGTITNFKNLAKIHLQLGETEEALQLIDRALMYAPEDEDLIELRRITAAFEIDPSEIEDTNPVFAVRLRADRLASPPGGGAGDIQAALDEVERGIARLNESHADYDTLFEIKARYLLALNRREDAERTLQQAARDFPDNKRFTALLDSLDREDSLESDFAAIDAMEVAPAIAYVMKHNSAQARGETQIAEEMLDKAIEADENSPQVIEAAFTHGVRTDDMARARRFADLAASNDVDQIKGQSYRARLQAAEGNLAGAITTLENAAKSRTAPAAIYRLLGMYQVEIGRKQEGIASLEEARRRAPTDVRSTIALIAALRSVGQPQRALSIARSAELFARGSSEFQRMLLELESTYGDKEAALADRQAIWNANPSDLDNAVALCTLQLSLNRFEDARELIDTLLAREQSSRTVLLDARWHARQGRIAEGRRVIQEFINDRKSAGEVTMADYGAYASYLLDQNLVDEALEVFDQARAIQEPETLRADAAKAELLFQLRRYEEAVEPFEKLIEIADDGAAALRGKLAECFVAMERYEDARRVIEEFGAGWRKEMPLALSRAATEAAAGDTEEAERILDETIQTYPNEPEPYVRRAAILRLDENKREDALQDISAALRRDPGNWQALIWRATINSELGRRDRALDALREAVRSNPSLDTERRVLLGNLLQTGRRRDAIAIAREAVEARTTDFALLLNLGDIFANWSLWDDANEFYAQAWSLSPNSASAYRFANSLLRKSTPDFAGVASVLASDAIDLDNSPDFLLLLAELRMKREQTLDARRAAIQAMNVAIKTGPTETGRVLEGMTRVFSTPAAAAQFIIDQRSALNALPDRWGEFLVATSMLRLPERRSEGQEMLRGLLTASNEDVAINARRVLAQDLMAGTRTDLEQAVALMLEGLEQTPNYWPYANNIAVIYAKEFGQPDEAVKYAERAFEIAPDSVYVLDTLAYVYGELGRFEESEKTFSMAVQAARDLELRLLTLLHLGQMFHKKGDKEEALRVIDRLDTLRAEMLPNAAPDPELEELREQVQSME